MDQVQGVIFDIDGTLLASNDSHAHAWVDAFSDFGWEIPFIRIKSLIGMGGDKLLATLLPGMSNEVGIGRVISQRRKMIFLERYAPSLKATPGSRAFVRHVKESGLKLVIATSAQSQELETLLEKAEVADLFDMATTSSDVDASKPAPDIVEAALAKVGLASEQVVMIGDTPYDIESAKRAGVGVIAVRTGGWADDALSEALAVYDSPGDILAHYDSSPLANTSA